MPRNSGGTYTLPVSNPVVTATTVSSTWANDTMNDIKTELTDSLSRSGKGGMSAALKIVDGSVSAPGIAFGSETGSGVYRNAAGDVRFAVLGADLLRYAVASVEVLGALRLTADEPNLNFYESDADSGERAWRLVAAAEKFYIQALNDAFSSGASPLAITRSGTAVTVIDFTATAVNINGSLVTTGIPTIQNAFPAVQLLDNDLTETTGKRWYIGTANDSFFVYRNTAAGGDFSTYEAIFQVNNASFLWMNNVVWHAGNDGPSSGLNADLLDGIEASGFGQISSGSFTVYLRGADDGANLTSGTAYWTKIGDVVVLRLPNLYATVTNTTLVVDELPTGIRVQAGLNTFDVKPGFVDGNGAGVALSIAANDDYMALTPLSGGTFSASNLQKGIQACCITYRV